MRELAVTLQCVGGRLVSPVTMLFLMFTSGHTVTQEGSVEPLEAKDTYSIFFTYIEINEQYDPGLFNKTV